MATVKLAFERQARRLPIDSILPLRTVPESVRKSQKYRRIEASLHELGVIEPLVVYPQRRGRGKPAQYLLLDGHVRHDILRSMGEESVTCLVATDDEAFTYNHKVNQISAIQEHFMILKALDSGVAEERIANALGIDVASIRRKRDLLDRICIEATELLKDRSVRPGTIRELRRVKPMRQIEMAELMIASRNFTVAYAKCLVAATAQDRLVCPETPKKIAGLKPEDIARIEREMQVLEGDFRRIEDSHGRNMLDLVVAVGYMRRLLQSGSVVRYISRKHADLLAELERIIESTDLGDASAGDDSTEPGG